MRSRYSMSRAVETVGYVNTALFVLLALVAFRLWQQGRGRPALWAALTFGSVGLVVASEYVLPEEPANDAHEVAERVDIALLVVFPYLLYRFTTAFEGATARLERFLVVMTAILVVWTFALPDFPAENEPQPTGFRLYLVAFLFHWTTLSVVAGVRLWRAGRGQPSVAQRRMRVLAGACIAITGAILLAGSSPDDDSWVSLVIALLVTLSGLGFLLGLAPPGFVRLLWRRPETERLQTAIASLMEAKTPDEVTNSVLPPMLRMVGARKVELRDERGAVVGAFTASDGRDDDGSHTLELPLAHGSLGVWTSRYAPFFGNEEFALLRTLGSLTVLALDRARLFGQEQEARRALEQADELKSNFVALAAHELRTPVAVIHGVIETLECRGDMLPEAQKRALEETLQAQTERLRMLVEQLLDLSRLDAHAVPIEPQRFSVRRRVEEIVRIAAGDGVQAVAIDVPTELEATVDPHAFDRILSNLVTNALKYGHPPVMVSARQENGHVHVAVEDRGPGVPSEFVPALFERFSRSDNSRRREAGTGLGLAIARSYAEAHRGELQYRQAEPHGARFEVVLPEAGGVAAAT